jgi:hypothetical protein
LKVFRYSEISYEVFKSNEFLFIGNVLEKCRWKTSFIATLRPKCRNYDILVVIYDHYDHLRPSTTIYDNLRPSTTIYDHLRPSTTIYDHLRPSTTTSFFYVTDIYDVFHGRCFWRLFMSFFLFRRRATALTAPWVLARARPKSKCSPIPA